MATALWEKIEAIRKEPESIRRRYVMACVSISMVFILGIWLLSVSDTVTTTAEDLPKAMEQGKNMNGGVPSLNNLFEQSAPLRIESKAEQSNEFIKQQIENDTQKEGR